VFRVLKTSKQKYYSILHNAKIFNKGFKGAMVFVDRDVFLEKRKSNKKRKAKSKNPNEDIWAGYVADNQRRANKRGIM
jgi:hypothetical protein